MEKMQVSKNRDGIYIPAEIVNKIRNKNHDAILIKDVDGHVMVTTVNSETNSHHRKIRPDGRVCIANCWLGSRKQFNVTVDRNKIHVR